MSLNKSMNDIISKNKLALAFILGLLTCYLFFNYGSCKEGFDDWVDCMCIEDNRSICDPMFPGDGVDDFNYDDCWRASMFKVSVDQTDYDA